MKRHTKLGVLASLHATLNYITKFREIKIMKYTHALKHAEYSFKIKLILLALT